MASGGGDRGWKDMIERGGKLVFAPKKKKKPPHCVWRGDLDAWFTERLVYELGRMEVKEGV